MSSIGNLLELISDISELFDEQSGVPSSKYTTASKKRNSVVNSKKENPKNKSSNDNIISAETLKNEESVLGNPPDRSSHVRESSVKDNSHYSLQKSQNTSIPNLNYKNLKNAIILSEILAPPLALRKRRYR